LHIIDKAAHFPGQHCASTGIRNLVNFHGFNWSEEICFGIGAGLGIWYLSFPGVSPSRLIHVRSEDIETQFFKRIGFPFQWEQYEDPAASEQAVIDKLKDGLPVMLQTDIFYLPYYNSKTHFPGHVITAWGYDLKERWFLISDTEREDFIKVSFDDMRKARYTDFGFFQSRGNFFAPEKLDCPKDIAPVIRKAIADNSSALLNSATEFSGLVALEKWEQELQNWAEFKDWNWTARFTYQVIERRGTGGGGFRLLYSRFLEEAAACLPQIELLGLSGMMREVASAWTELAEALKIASEKETFEFEIVKPKLRQLNKLETAYHHQAVKLVETR